MFLRILQIIFLFIIKQEGYFLFFDHFYFNSIRFYQICSSIYKFTRIRIIYIYYLYIFFVPYIYLRRNFSPISINTSLYTNRVNVNIIVFVFYRFLFCFSRSSVYVDFAREVSRNFYNRCDRVIELVSRVGLSI